MVYDPFNKDRNKFVTRTNVTFAPGKKHICLYNCSCDGHTNNPNDKTPHFFIIMSPKNYNERSRTLLALPITSEGENFFVKDYGLPLDYDHFEGGKIPQELYKKSFVCCDKPCRIKKDDVVPKGKDSIGAISVKAFTEILDKVIGFMRES